MKITIHRGTDQIGGCITEYELDGWKLFVDFGDQLPGAKKSDEPIEIEGLNCGDTSKSALLITHYHGDHVGKLADADPNVPVFMGHVALDIFCKLQRRLSFIKGELGEKARNILSRCQTIKTFLDGEIFTFGPFVIEPVKMNHSAYDAYGFLIQNSTDDSDLVFHTGDFRASGIFGEEFYEKITSIPEVRAIVCEGTNIEKEEEKADPEYTIEQRFEKFFKENKYNVVFVSSTNIDRLFGIYHAATAAGRPVIMDEYQFEILKSVIGENDWSNNDLNSITIVDEDGDEQPMPLDAFYQFDKDVPLILKLDRHSKRTPKFFIPHKINKLINWKGCVLFARSTPQFISLIESFPKGEVKKYLSMWNGYLDSESPAFNANLKNAIGDDYEYVHTSGHADPSTLEELFKNVVADMIIPMHTSNPRKFLERFPEKDWNIRLMSDGETIDLENEELTWDNDIV